MNTFAKLSPGICQKSGTPNIHPHHSKRTPRVGKLASFKVNHWAQGCVGHIMVVYCTQGHAGFMSSTVPNTKSAELLICESSAWSRHDLFAKPERIQDLGLDLCYSWHARTWASSEIVVVAWSRSETRWHSTEMTQTLNPKPKTQTRKAAAQTQLRIVESSPDIFEASKASASYTWRIMAWGLALAVYIGFRGSKYSTEEVTILIAYSEMSTNLTAQNAETLKRSVA